MTENTRNATKAKNETNDDDYYLQSAKPKKRIVR